MGAWGPSAITGMSLERIVAQMPAAVVVVEALSGEIVHLNARAQEMTERQLGRAVPPELTPDWEIFHLDGRPYTMDEWPLVRSIATGEEVADEEYVNVLPDGSRMIMRASSSPIHDDEGQIVAGVLVMTDVTEQKAQEERLTYLAGLLDNTEDAIVALDSEWFVTVWNKGAERLYGWTADEVVGRHTLDVARLEMSDEERAEVRVAAAERGRWRGEVVAYRKDGTPVCVELITVALRGALGEITGYLGIHRDMTDRKRAEEALREAQRRTETILENMSDEFFALDRDWRYTYVNERALAQTRRAAGRDISASELLGMSVWELMPHHVGTAAERELRRAMRERTVAQLEVYSEPTGRWVEVRVYPTEDGLAGYTRDISDRKAAQEEMKRRAEQQALVAQLGLRALASDDLQSLLDEAVGLVARTLDVELAGVAELARGGEEIVFRAGIGWRQGVVGGRIGPVDRDALMGYTLRVGEPVIVEDMSTDGRFRLSAISRDHGVVSALSVMIETPDEPFGALGAFSTRRRTFAETDVSFVQAVANVLAGAVERSRAQDRLIEVREIERRRIARDLHDEALQGLTHAVVLASRAARGVPDRPDELTAALKRVGEQLRGAIYDLRLEEEEQTPFPELLEALVAVHRAMAGASGEIELDVGDGTPAGPLGATGIEVLRILGEALTNARRHAHARHVRVRVRASDRTLSAEVSDDGKGFASAVQSVPAGGHGTTGMRERAELLHGRLDIASDPAAGTTVRLEVPLVPRGAVERVRVLLVEDQTAVREAIASAFARETGFDVVGQASSLAEARDMLNDVDVAVIDLGLPDGFGADVIEELHALNPGAQALVLSATVDHAVVARAIQHGAAVAIDKMAHLDEIVDAVRRLRAGETLLPLHEVVELLRFAGRQQEQERRDRAAIARLTPREREVLQALGDGLDSQQIAARLDITIRTERNHVAGIFAKLGVHSQLQAVLFALRYGVIELH